FGHCLRKRLVTVQFLQDRMRSKAMHDILRPLRENAMTIHRSTFRKLALSSFLLVLPLNSAFAQDTAAVADRLKAALAGQGIAIDWTGISGDAAHMVLEGVTL